MLKVFTRARSLPDHIEGEIIGCRSPTLDIEFELGVLRIERGAMITPKSCRDSEAILRLVLEFVGSERILLLFLNYVVVGALGEHNELRNCKNYDNYAGQESDHAPSHRLELELAVWQAELEKVP